MSVFKPKHLPFKILSSVLLASLLTTPVLANAKRHHKSHHHSKYSYVMPKRHHARKHHKAHHKRGRKASRKHRYGYKHHKRSPKRHHKKHSGFSDDFFDDDSRSHAKPVNTNAPSDNDDGDDENSDPIQQSELDALNGINDDADDGDGDDDTINTPANYTPTPSDTPSDDGSVDTSGTGETTQSLDSGNPIDKKASHQFYKDIIKDRKSYIKESPKLDAKATQDAEKNFGNESTNRIARGSFQASADDYANTSNYIMVTNTMNDNADGAFMNTVGNPYWNRVGVGVAGDSNYLSYSAVFEHVNPPKHKSRK